MEANQDLKSLQKENERLRKENALQKELIAILRELPTNRERELPSQPDTNEEAEAKKPRKKKSPRPGAVPPAAAVDPTPPPGTR